MKSSIAKGATGLALALAGLSAANAQEYPNKPLHFMIPGPGGLDVIARKFLPSLAESFGQPLVIENLPGGPRPGVAVMKADPDGYTLFLTGRGHWLAPLTLKDPPYDPIKDFAAIGIVYNQPYVLIVNNKLPVKNVKELLTLAKQQPGKIDMGSGTPTSTGALGGLLFRQKAGVNIQAIPYKTGSARGAALLSGEIQMDFLSSSETLSFGKNERLRPIAISSDRPSPQFPGLPTIASTVRGFEYGSNGILFAPAKTPVAIVNRVNQELNKVLKKPDVIKLLAELSSDPVGGTPAQAANFIRQDLDDMAKLLKAEGVKPE